jgi:hypothetical protein
VTIPKCDADAAQEAERHRYERFEALSSHIAHGIRTGVGEHNKHEIGIGFLPATPAEIRLALAEAIGRELHDDERIEALVEDLRNIRDPDWYEQI